MPSKSIKCPTCGASFLISETLSMPFCSQRCQQIDLGRWLNEEIGVPFEGDADGAPVELISEEQDELRRGGLEWTGDHWEDRPVSNHEWSRSNQRQNQQRG